MCWRGASPRVTEPVNLDAVTHEPLITDRAPTRAVRPYDAAEQTSLKETARCDKIVW